MHDKAIKCQMDCHLKIDILTLGKAMEHSDLATMLGDRLISDLCVMGVIGAIHRVNKVFAYEFEFLCQDKFSLVKSLELI